jgi:Xaa-Pro aminopeptidase
MREERNAGSRLAQLLEEARSPYDLAGIEKLIDGVLAAPQRVGTRWHPLVAPSVPPALAEALERRRAEKEAAYRDGLSAADFVQLPRRERLLRLRTALAARRLDGFLVPRADAHQGEFVAASSERLAWLTGFTGSAGLAVVLEDRAALFVDGRYTLQAAREVERELYEIRHLVEEPPHGWIAASLKRGMALGYDPWLTTRSEVERLRAAAQKAGALLRPVEENPLDGIWQNRPAPPLAPVVPHEERFAGESSASKRGRLGEALGREGVSAAVLTLPESIAWLLNIRGGDVPHTPLALSFAILYRDGRASLFIDRRKLAPETLPHLGAAVAVFPQEGFAAALEELAAAGESVRVDPATAASWIFDRLERAAAKVERGADPCLLAKARKNPVELAGARAAHRRDGVALTRFLAWLSDEAPKGALTEIAASDRLETIRAEGEYFRDLSFATISGTGAHGAIVHYRATVESDARLEKGMLYLVDSGAQYLDGTTDVTRTVAIGAPSAEMRERFTRVLKGHIALALTRFPKGTSGAQLDAFARRALWEEGLDYDHGTGHGVGSYLGVHEGPQRISKAGTTQPLLPGMIVSDEPGYYKNGEYGIRIENLLIVEVRSGSGAREMLGFETLTLAPIDRALIDGNLLDGGERAWLDAYHARVRAEISPLVDERTRAWLEAATAPLAGPATARSKSS